MELRKDEIILKEVNLHWIVYVQAAFLDMLGAVLVVMGALQSEMVLVAIGGVLFLPFIWVYFVNKFKEYVVTNQRVYIKTGIIARNENEVPIKKINNVELRQTIAQRICGAGDILMFTGNDTPLIIRDIDDPKEFKEAVSKAVEGLIC